MEPWPGTRVHVEWGEAAARLAAARGDDVVVVDVLSFSTTICVALERGFTVWVYDRESAAAAAERLGVRLMDRYRDGQVSLSPARVLAAEPGQEVVFTSLNGAAVTRAAAAAPWLAFGCLRNRLAVAAAVDERLREGAARVTVVPAGERWSTLTGEEGLRPGVEDWVGAGGIVSALVAAGHSASPEAMAAAAAYEAGLDLAGCVSARELVEGGFPEDVELAFADGVSGVVPVRGVDGRFTNCPCTGRTDRFTLDR